MSDVEFKPFPKIARLSRKIIVTEKIDGTNAQIYITEHGDVLAGSRKRWITPQDDNFGFAAWAESNNQDLLSLGAGQHFGEWWGRGIQRGYGIDEKRFSLFNTSRWEDERPECCGVVPILYEGMFSEDSILECLNGLEAYGSIAASGFMNPEGVVIYHAAGNVGFKKTIKNDDVPKG